MYGEIYSYKNTIAQTQMVSIGYREVPNVMSKITDKTTLIVIQKDVMLILIFYVYRKLMT